MRTNIFRHGLAAVPNGKESLSSLCCTSPSGWGRALACVLAVLMMMSTGCDPKAPPTEDLGTVLSGPPTLPDTEEPYELPENVAKAKEEWEREHPPSDTME